MVKYLWMMMIFGAASAAMAFPGAVNVKDFGAKGDAVTDDTAAFQAALDAAAPTGSTVECPPARYVFRGTISIPPGVCLQGTWAGPHAGHLTLGTAFYVYSGKDDEQGQPFISMQTASTLKGVTIFYPEQKINDFHPFPWTIQCRGQHFNVLDTVIVNAWNGIDCGTYHNEGHHLRNVYMCALRRGVLIDQTTDVGRVENVHIHTVYWWRVPPPYQPTGEEVEALNKFTAENLEGFIIGRTDWEFMSNCFVIWAKVGMHFVRTTTPAGGLANVVITQCGSDIGPLAVQVDEVQAHAGIAFENCQFMAGFEIGPDNRGPVKIANSGFWGTSGDGPQMVLKGSGTVFLSTVHFDEWAGDTPCIDAFNGSLIVQGCDFMDTGTQIKLGTDVISAVLIGNRMRDGINIVNESNGQVELVGNLAR